MIPSLPAGPNTTVYADSISLMLAQADEFPRFDKFYKFVRHSVSPE